MPILNLTSKLITNIATVLTGSTYVIHFGQLAKTVDRFVEFVDEVLTTAYIDLVGQTVDLRIEAHQDAVQGRKLINQHLTADAINHIRWTFDVVLDRY